MACFDARGCAPDNKKATSYVVCDRALMACNVKRIS